MYEERAPIPTPRGGVAGAVLGGRLFVFGGEGNEANQPDRIFTNVEAYDPSTNTWQEYAEMLVPRHGLGAAALNDRIYLPGGATQRGFGPVADHTAVHLE
jgi:N-acetylneuraminic acid mutarotase